MKPKTVERLTWLATFAAFVGLDALASWAKGQGNTGTNAVNAPALKASPFINMPIRQSDQGLLASMASIIVTESQFLLNYKGISSALTDDSKDNINSAKLNIVGILSRNNLLPAEGIVYDATQKKFNVELLNSLTAVQRGQTAGVAEAVLETKTDKAPATVTLAKQLLGVYNTCVQSITLTVDPTRKAKLEAQKKDAYDKLFTLTSTMLQNGTATEVKLSANSISNLLSLIYKTPDGKQAIIENNSPANIVVPGR